MRWQHTFAKNLLSVVAGLYEARYAAMRRNLVWTGNSSTSEPGGADSRMCYLAHAQVRTYAHNRADTHNTHKHTT